MFPLSASPGCTAPLRPQLRLPRILVARSSFQLGLENTTAGTMERKMVPVLI